VRCSIDSVAESRVAACLHSRDDLDRRADRKIKVAVCAALIDGDLGKPVRVLIPERRSGRQIAEAWSTAFI
jgi:hypothetical protein